MDIARLTNIAIEAAKRAGSIIHDYIDDDMVVEQKKGGDSHASQVVTKIDILCEKEILAHLRTFSEEFDLALLSEETTDDGSRFRKPYFWCIDPLDGTLPFIEKRPGFSVSIALVDRQGIPHIGVVYDPSSDTLYHAIKGGGAFKNEMPWVSKCKNRHLTYITDRPLDQTPQQDEILQWLSKKADQFNLDGVKVVEGGGAVINVIRVIENGPACMLKYPKKTDGGGSIWDYAATACICNELQLPATNFEGGRLDLNRAEGTFMNHEGVFYSNFP